MKLSVNEKGTIELENVFNPIKLVTEQKEELTICMRDSGFEFNYNGTLYSAQNGILREMQSSKKDTLNQEDVDKEKQVAEIPDPSHFMKLGEEAFIKNVAEKLRAETSQREKIMWLQGYLLAVTQYRKR
jgi:hypothetical protein